MALTFLQAANSGANTSTRTFTSQNLGTAASDRYIVVALSARNTGTPALTSVTVGGVTATIVVNQVRDSGGARDVAAIAIAAVPTGTAGDVVLTFSSSTARGAIAIYRLDGLQSATPSDTGAANATSPSVTLSIPDGCVVAITAAEDTTGVPSAWTGVTQDFSVTIEALSTASASDNDVPANASYTVGATTAGSTALAVAAWEWASSGSSRRLPLSLLGIGT